MSPLGTVLAVTDFSAPARHAADRAARLARETHSPLTLMHVLQGNSLQTLRQWLGSDNTLEAQLHEDAQRQLLALAADLEAHRHVKPEVLNASGSVTDEIIQAADRMDAGLLVLGARGTGFLRRMVLGSTSERLLRRTKRPLLVVRQTPHEPYRRVLVALDFSPWSAHAIALARRVAPHAKLLLFNAYQVPFEEKLRFAGVDTATIDLYRRHAQAEAQQRVQALARSSGLTPPEWEACVVEGDASLRLLELEQEHGCDLVVLGKHGQSVTEDLLLGSVSKHVLAEGGCDVLVSTAHEAP